MYNVILIAAASLVIRCLPHPPNFAPIMAACLLISTHSTFNRWWALPIFLLCSDLMLEACYQLGLSSYQGLYSGMWVIYVCYVVSVLIANACSTMRPIAASICFYLSSNCSVWYVSGMYTHDTSGLIKCYTMALPFFKYSIMSDVIYYYAFTALCKGSRYVFLGDQKYIKWRISNERIIEEDRLGFEGIKRSCG